MLSQLYEIQFYNLKVVFIYVWKILRKNKMVVVASIMVRLTPLSSLYLNGMASVRESHTLVDDTKKLQCASVSSQAILLSYHEVFFLVYYHPERLRLLLLLWLALQVLGGPPVGVCLRWSVMASFLLPEAPPSI